MSIAANRHAGIRAAVCNDSLSTTEKVRAHNDANILCLGGRVVSIDYADQALTLFLDTPFEGGRHLARVHKIEQF
jgi:ribose 5-phosphate isomerase B